MAERFPHIEVEPAVGALGAFVGGVDLTADLAEPVVHEIRQAWLDHVVLFFRGQLLGPERLLAFARTLGEPVQYPFLPGLAGHEDITVVAKLPDDKVGFGTVWHTDMAYVPQPPMGTLLLAQETPDSGGDTLWSNLYAALAALSPGMQDLLGGLTIVHSSAMPDVSRTRHRVDGNAAPEDPVLEAEHKLVRSHPESGRPVLYFSPAHAQRFRDMTAAESRPLIDWLAAHVTRPEFTCRLRWSPGTLALWDNRCALHLPIDDYHGKTRIMHRVAIAAPVSPGGRAPASR